MEKKPYETPQVRSLGSVSALTSEPLPPCSASIETDASTADYDCIIEI